MFCSTELMTLVTYLRDRANNANTSINLKYQMLRRYGVTVVMMLYSDS